MLTIGLDVHQTRTSVCVLDALGNTVRQQEVRGGFAQVAELLKGIGEPFQVCYEASTGYGTLHGLLEPLAARIAVAHPGKLRLIYRSKKKHNRADAQKLAALMHLNQVPCVHVPGREVRSRRGLIEHRRRLVDQGVGLKNQVRALLRGQGMQGLSGRRQWFKAGTAWLKELTWSTPVEAFRLGVLLEQIRENAEKISRTEKLLDQMAKGDKRVALLLTIPGVGPRTAEAFMAYVDDPGRFTSATIGSYFGLVPREDSTGEKRRLGHITREGPPTVRKLLTEAGWRGVSESPTIRAVFERHLKGDKGRRKIALVATGHWLSRVMLAIVKSGEAFKEAETQA